MLTHTHTHTHIHTHALTHETHEHTHINTIILILSIKQCVKLMKATLHDPIKLISIFLVKYTLSILYRSFTILQTLSVSIYWEVHSSLLVPIQSFDL